MTEAFKLPIRPHLDHLRKEAKQRLAVLKALSVHTRLADAQLCIAREYGFSSWRAMKAEVDRRSLGAANKAPPAPVTVSGLARRMPRAVPPGRFLALRDSTGIEQILYPCVVLTMAAASVIGAITAYLIPA